MYGLRHELARLEWLPYSHNFSTMAEISTNKRRRKDGLQLSDLPDNAVAHVATYLSNISRDIFAIASPSASKSTILSSDAKLWETLDFGDIDKSLARKLRDGGLCEILTIINAVNNTKCIKLTGCVNIDGSGLSPLRGSIVLKQLDLGLVGQFESPELDPEHSISEDVVIPILTSIISAHGNKMTHLQLPKKWRNNKDSALLTTFLEAYNAVLASRHCKCKACDTLINSTGDRQHVIIQGSLHGIQNFICYTCLESFCDMACNNENGRDMLGFCYHCMKDFCINCNEIEGCHNCGHGFCSGCDALKSCTSCDMVFCMSCGPSNKCASKDKVLCGDCAQRDGFDDYGYCSS